MEASAGVETLTRQMADALADEVELYGALRDLAKKKKEILIRGGLDDLETLTQAEQLVLLRAARAEERRSGIQRALGESVGVPDALKTIVAELREINSLNRKLIEQSLQYIDFCLNLLINEARPTYSRNGDGGSPVPGPFLNRRA